MDLDQKAPKDLAKMAAWTEDSLGHARELGQRKLIWLLGAVKADVELEGALLAVPSGEHLGPARGGVRGETARNNARNTDTVEVARKRKREEEKDRDHLAAWERFMETELRELGLRQGGQLGRLLGEALPGEPPAALRHLASKDRRKAEVGLVALMRGGKVSYKRVEELREGAMPARAANRLRTTWLKERRDGWLASSRGGRTR